MPEQVRNQDIFSADVIKKTTEQAKELLGVLDQMEVGFKDVAKAQQEIVNQEDNKTIQSVNRTKTAIKELTDVQRAAEKVQKQRKNLSDQLRIANSKEGKANAELRVQLQQQNKTIQQTAKENAKLVGSYAALSAKLIRLRKEYKDVAISEGETSKRALELAGSVRKLDARLKKVDKTVGQSQRNVGNYGRSFQGATNQLRNFAGALGITAGIAGLVRVMSSSIKKAKEFEQGNANLAAILGKTSGAIGKLTDDSRRLGASTSFTATQVSTLQTEFAKLGFNEDEILKATESTLNLAAATGSDLAESAAIAGATLGGFGLDASKTTRITDVMAKAFSTSALDMEKFKESMKDAAPAARAVGVDVEKTTALLGTLANAGISGSKAGNALKAGFIELNAAGVTLDQALVKISKSNNKLATATALVGKRAATSFLVLSSGVKTTAELEKGLRNAGGAAEKMAKEQLATLEGRTKIMNSAWEGMVLSLLDSDSAFNTVAVSVTDLATNVLGFLTVTEQLSDQLQKQADSLLTMTIALNDVNTNTSTRLEIMEQLNREYPTLLKNLGFEKVGLDNVNEAVQALNKNLSERANVQKAVEETTGANNVATKQAEARQKSINKFIFNGTKNLQENGLAHLLVNKTIDEQIKIIDENQTFWQSLTNEVANVENATVDLNNTTKENSDRLAENKEFILGVLKSKKDLNNLTTEELRALAKSNILKGNALQREAKEIIILRERNKLTEDNTEVLNENTEATKKNKKEKRKLTGLIEKQAKVVSDLNEQINRATSEKDIFDLTSRVDVAKEELARLKRIVTSTFEEIDKIERNLIEDSNEKRIAQEIAKSEKLIQQIESNSRIETSKKEELIEAENKRLGRFIDSVEVKAGKERIKRQSDLAKAEFEQRRTGFKTEEAFEKEKAAQFLAIRRKAIEEEIKLLEQFGGKGSDVRIKQLNAELEGLNKFGKGFEKLKDVTAEAIDAIGSLIDEQFEKRIERIGERLEKTGENVDRLRDKAAEGQLASEESLAFEQKQEAELQRQREREQKRQERTQAFFAVLSSFNANDGNLAKTITDISVLRGLAGGLSAFDGVDDTGARGNVDSKGGKLWTLHPHESVNSLQDRKDMKNPKTGKLRNRKEIKDIVQMHDNGTLSDLLKHDASNEFMQPGAFVLNGMNLNPVVDKLDQLDQSIKAIEPISGSVSIDEVKKVIVYTYKQGNRTKTERSKLF